MLFVLQLLEYVEQHVYLRFTMLLLYRCSRMLSSPFSLLYLPEVDDVFVVPLLAYVEVPVLIRYLPKNDDVDVMQLFENVEFPIPLLCLPEVDDVIIILLLENVDLR